MKLLRGITASNPAFAAGCAVTIGNFDGVHAGHQALLAKLREEAALRGVPTVVVLFEPQPGEYFRPREAPARLASLREKLDVLKQCGIDYVFCLRFNSSLADMEPAFFAQQYFFNVLHARYLLIGNDFRFGRQRQGDVALLTQLAAENNGVLDIFPDFTLAQERISSTKIRALLAQGDFAHAKVLLGRPYSLCGRVIRGAGRGKQWGVPTANLAMHRLTLPLQGVFCVQVQRKNGQWLKGIANLGNRPTVDGTQALLEVHLFDWQGDLYGDMLQVFFVHKLRDEIKFSAVEQLIAQIHRDIAAAKKYSQGSSKIAF